jgi:hypothetical protein
VLGEVDVHHGGRWRRSGKSIRVSIKCGGFGCDPVDTPWVGYDPAGVVGDRGCATMSVVRSEPAAVSVVSITPNESGRGGSVEWYRHGLIGGGIGGDTGGVVGHGCGGGDGGNAHGGSGGDSGDDRGGIGGGNGGGDGGSGRGGGNGGVSWECVVALPG